MAVRDDRQRQGVETTLLTAALDLADNWPNLIREELRVYTDNAAGIALYETFGSRWKAHIAASPSEKVATWTPTRWRVKG